MFRKVLNACNKKVPHPGIVNACGQIIHAFWDSIKLWKLEKIEKLTPHSHSFSFFISKTLGGRKIQVPLFPLKWILDSN